MAVILTLGPVLFADFEVPETINFGGAQVLATHKLVGGTRVIDVMGPDDDDIKWAGRFRGSDALYRAQFLDYLRIGGQSLPLQWDSLNFTVVIKDYKADYKQNFEIPYSIICEILTNNLSPILQAEFTVDSAVGNALNGALQSAALLNLPGVSSAITAVQSATSSVQTFEGIGSNAAAGTLSAIASAQSAVFSAVSISDAATVAGSLVASSGANISSMISGLTSQAQGFQQSSALRNIGAQLGTMATNIGNAMD